jgi:hypothetical protein
MFIKSPLSGVGNFANLVKSLQGKQAIYVVCPERTRQALYLTYKRNIEVRSHELCCLVKAMIYAYSEGLSLSLSYPACNARTPYFHPWPVLALPFFPLYLITQQLSEKDLLNIKCAF